MPRPRHTHFSVAPCHVPVSNRSLCPVKSRRLLLLIALLIFMPQFAFAHHGKDFLLVESYDVPEPGDFYLFSSAGTLVVDGDTALELEPALLVGIVPRLAFELHAHIDKEPENALQYEATAPSLHFQVTPPESRFPVQVGLSAEYEFASGVEAKDRVETRLIGERAIGRAKLVGNLIVEHERAGDTTPGYGVGFRYEVTDQFAGGLEAQGPFTHAHDHEVLAGAYAEPTERVTLKAGLGAAIADQAVGFVARIGIVLRL
jgi:hypothetical protein